MWLGPPWNRELYLEACVRDGAEELTLSAEEADVQKTFIDVSLITNDKWGSASDQ